MNDFEGLLATDYGFKPQGKSAPMAASSMGPSNPSPGNSVNFDLGSYGDSRSTKHSSSFSGSLPNDGDSIFAPMGSRKNQNLGDLDDFLGGSGKSRNKVEIRQGDTNFNFDPMFRGSSNTGAPSMNSPNYDKPVYDDDIFDGVPGLKSSSKVNYDKVFVSPSSPSTRNTAFDDLLGGFGKAESVANSKSSRSVEKDEKGIPAFDDFLPGFGGGSSPGDRTTSEAKWSSEPTPARTSFKPVEDPFMVSGNFSNPLDDISKLGNSAKISSTSAANNRVFEDVDPFAGLGKSVPAFSSEANNAKKDSSPSRLDMSSSGSQSSTNKATTEKTSVRSPKHFKPKKSVEYDSQTDQTLFDIPTSSSDSQNFVSRSASPPFDATTGSKENNFQGNKPPMFENNLDFSDDVWLTVSEIPLFTQPTYAPPPSRPPPPIPGQVPKSGMGPSTSTYSKKKTNDFSFPNSTGNFQASKFTPTSLRASDVSPQDEFEEFSMGDSQSNIDGLSNGLSNEEFEMNSAAAAMKEAMDRAEAKFKHAKELREREGTKPARSKEAGQLDKDEKLVQDERARRQERIDRERLQREKEEEEREKQRMERERESARDIEKEREAKETEQRILEKERELEIERAKARQLVERATKEARERAAADARVRAERAAVDKVHAQARERAERAAVQKAQAEARERAATEARERAEKAAAEARERANMEAKEREARESVSARTEARARAERVVVERAAAEARERAAASAAAAASASARTNQERNENDLDSFFGLGTRASSALRHRTAPSENFFDPQPQSRYGTETAKTASVSTSSMRKASSATNIVDDLSSIFGAAPSSRDFQDVEGESEERRKARLERHRRTQERTAKALAEKNQRDLQIQREQAERHRIAETLDVEIKRWAAGKEGNLRALLSTLQYVLWPECGWQPVSLTDLITGAAVKKVYRKATLCIHPDKVQQKGANLQQKYVAEKVFDILKEAWNKFNSEELF